MPIAFSDSTQPETKTDGRNETSGFGQCLENLLFWRASLSSFFRVILPYRSFQMFFI